MQDDERHHDDGRVRDPEGRGHNREASQEGQEARQPARGHDGEHWDHEQYVADTVIERRALQDEHPDRPERRHTDDQHRARSCELGRDWSQSHDAGPTQGAEGGARPRPCSTDPDRHAEQQQRQKALGQARQELSGDVPGGHVIGERAPAPVLEFERGVERSKVPIGLEELYERMSGLQPRPERNRR